ncbi:MAG: DUF547 domain-containing protein [Desulfobacterales bacterium]|nr:DUF547 domain-containing protein [Desulfobacterales bacterium]
MLIFIFVMFGCTKIEPTTFTDEQVVEPRILSHASFDRLLQRFVDHEGRVNYSALKQDSRDLDQYYHLIATFSPDSHPDLFPSESHKLAYWINAYNATAIKTVLTYYPISSVLDVKPPAVFFFLSEKSGFFVFQRLTYGGKTTSLYYLGNGVIRERFQEPRIHFALNCAALGCPRLPRQAFSGEDLERQLDQETRKFLSEARNFRIDHSGKTIYMSSIFKWYEDDFLNWYQKNYSESKASLVNYIALYLTSDKAAELKEHGNQYALRFLPYDWGLNDKK